MLKANPLLDSEFLKKLDSQTTREIYAKIILMTFDEHPIKEIQGRITQGSVNIDGASAVRRTCSLSMLAGDLDINDYYWGIKDKFKLEIGVANNIDNRYPEIIWFPQGLFVATALNENLSAQGYTISISGKDKMCLLNGDIGGNLPFSVDFGKQEFYEKTGGFVKAEVDKNNFKTNKYFVKRDNVYVLCTDINFNPHETYFSEETMVKYERMTIKEIIQEAVSTFGGENLANIAINDLENFGLQLLECRTDVPMYLIKRIAADKVTNITFDEDKTYYLASGAPIQIKEIPFYDPFITHLDSVDTTLVYPTAEDAGNPDKAYSVAKVEYGTTVGYYITPLTYAGELISNVGETLTSVLDKLVQMLGDFEYFYDLDGKFVFQKKHTYLHTSWNNLKVSNNSVYAEDSAYTSSSVYSFEGNKLITAFQNNPTLNNLRNDFAIWGKRIGPGGAEYPVHMRYAIDSKPTFYRTIAVSALDTTVEGQPAKPQESKVYLSYDYVDDTKEYEGYPRYDWREIIYQMAIDYFQYHHDLEDFQSRVADANFRFYPLGITGYERYYTDMEGFWRQLYNPQPDEDDFLEYDKYTFWNKKVTNAPEELNFWIDFMDDDGEMGKYAISAIGDRPKAVNDNDVKAIYFRDTPSVLYLSEDEYDDLDRSGDLLNYSGYTFLKRTSQSDNYFNISAQGKSAKDQLDSLLYQHTYFTDNVTITTVPIYYLQPNYRIFVNDEKTGINGEYIVSKLTVPLSYSGTMSITASKAVSRIY